MARGPSAPHPCVTEPPPCAGLVLNAGVLTPRRARVTTGRWRYRTRPAPGIRALSAEEGRLPAWAALGGPPQVRTSCLSTEEAGSTEYPRPWQTASPLPGAGGQDGGGSPPESAVPGSP